MSPILALSTELSDTDHVPLLLARYSCYLIHPVAIILHAPRFEERYN